MLQKITFTALALLFFADIATAQPSEIVIDASSIPIVDVSINGQHVRLQVDPALPDVLVVNTQVAERLGLRNLPLSQARAVMDNAVLSGRMARPDLRFANGETERVTALIFGAPVTDAADGAIGPGALPYDIVTLRLGPDQSGAQVLPFPLADADLWNTPVQVSETREFDVGFMLARPYSMLNRPAAGLLEVDSMLTPAGPLEEREFLLGLRSLMQPVNVDSSLNVAGLGLASVVARTASPIIGADEDAVFVVAESDAAPMPRLTLGREALSVCSTLSVTRRSRILTLRCAL